METKCLTKQIKQKKVALIEQLWEWRKKKIEQKKRRKQKLNWKSEFRLNFQVVCLHFVCKTVHSILRQENDTFSHRQLGLSFAKQIAMAIVFLKTIQYQTI